MLHVCPYTHTLHTYNIYTYRISRIGTPLIVFHLLHLLANKGMDFAAFIATMNAVSIFFYKCH